MNDTRIIKNYLYNLIYQILTILLPIITIPYISRVLKAEGIGIYALTNTCAQYFIFLGMLGLAVYSSREIAYVREDKEKLNKVFWELNLIRFISMGISTLFYIIIFGFIVKSEYKYIYMIQILILISSMVDISWLFVGMEKFGDIVLRNTIVKLLGVILIFLLVKNSSQVWLYAFILGITQLLGQLIMWIDLPKEIKFKLPKERNLIRHFKLSIKLFIPQIAINVYTMLDKIMLGIFTDEVQVGMYDNSQRVIKIVVVIVTTLSTVMVPRMANLYNNNKSEFLKNVYKSFSFVSFIAFPMSFGLIAISKSFIPWFYGQGFNGIEPMFYIGSFLIITLGWTSILGNQILISIKRENQFTIAVTIGAIVNLIFNFLLIGQYKGVGTTISSLLAEYIGMFLMLFFLRDIINIKKLFTGIYKYAVSSLVMFFIVYIIGVYMPATIITTFFQIFIGVFIYMSIMFIVKDPNLMYALKFIINLIRKFKKSY